jgi:PhnB protein
MNMRYKLLGRTGLRVSELCLGAMIFGDSRGGWGASKDEAARIVQRFAEAGGNLVDTANYYAHGESERIVGELIKTERERWVLSTKYTLTMRPEDPNGGGAHRKSLVQSLEASLRRLGTDYLDLYWVHIWDAFTPAPPHSSHIDKASLRAWPSEEEAMPGTKPVAEREQTITPNIVVRDAAAASEWYQRALGAKERGRIPVPGGKFMRIELHLGASTVMIVDEFPGLAVVSPLSLGGTDNTLTIHTDDVEAFWQRELDAGAEVSLPLQDAFWGDRHGEIIDPFGHRWALAQHLRDVPADELKAAVAAMFGGEPE